MFSQFCFQLTSRRVGFEGHVALDNVFSIHNERFHDSRKKIVRTSRPYMYVGKKKKTGKERTYFNNSAYERNECICRQTNKELGVGATFYLKRVVGKSQKHVWNLVY